MVIGVGEINVGNMLQLPFKEGAGPAPGVIDDLVRHHHMGRAHGLVDTTHGIHPHHGSNPGIVQSLQVGAVVHLVGRNAVRIAVAGQEHHRLFPQPAMQQFV